MSFQECTGGGPVFMTSTLLPVVHGFTTRFGGVSGGIYASLNLGPNQGDAPGHVRENYARLADALGLTAPRFAFSKQVHGAQVRRMTRSDCKAPYEALPYEADSIITNDPGVPLVIFTADCVPILLYDPVGCAIGAVHAGWRGTAADIVGETVREMARSFGTKPEHIRAAIGPSISQCCFETDREVPDTFFALLEDDAAAFVKPGRVLDGVQKYQVDLKGLNSALLRRAGVPEACIDSSPECTMCAHEKYWSHRKTHGKRGSQASVITLKGHMS